MDMTGSLAVPAPVDTVWRALNDPAMLKQCIAGCESIEPDGENSYKMVMAAKVGPVSAKFAGKMRLTDIVPPTSYTLHFEGTRGLEAAGAQNELQSAIGNLVNNAVRYTPEGGPIDVTWRLQADGSGEIS